MIVILILGPELFAFTSLEDWNEHARDLFGRFYATTGIGLHDTLAVDRNGRVCSCGRDYMRADRDGAYPIRVYAIDPAQSPPAPLPASPESEASRAT